MKHSEPPSLEACAKVFLIGKNSRGNWVVQDQQQMCGGLFVDRTQALRFAMFENGRHPEAIMMVPGVFELDTSRKSAAVQNPSLNTDAPRERRGRLMSFLSFLFNPFAAPVWKGPNDQVYAQNLG